MDKFSQLPTDIIIKIALDLDLPEVLRFCETSPRIYNAICNNKNYWANKLQYDFNLTYQDYKSYIPPYSESSDYPRMVYERLIKEPNNIYHRAKELRLEALAGAAAISLYKREFSDKFSMLKPGTLYYLVYNEHYLYPTFNIYRDGQATIKDITEDIMNNVPVNFMGDPINYKATYGYDTRQDMIKAISQQVDSIRNRHSVIIPIPSMDTYQKDNIYVITKIIK